MQMLVKLFSMMLPWFLRRRVLNHWFGYQIHPSAEIGLAWIFPQKLIMGPGSKIRHFTVAVNLDMIEMKEKATIGRSNWITGFSTKSKSIHFNHQLDRKSVLIVGKHSAITKNHHIDCTNIITIGDFVTIAGYQSQILTHSVNVFENRQDSRPIFLGDYTFIGTNVVILGGAYLPSHSVLAAKSMLSKAYEEEWKVYGGIPAKPIADIKRDAKYFTRDVGFVV